MSLDVVRALEEISSDLQSPRWMYIAIGRALESCGFLQLALDESAKGALKLGAISPAAVSGEPPSSWIEHAQKEADQWARFSRPAAMGHIDHLVLSPVPFIIEEVKLRRGVPYRRVVHIHAVCSISCQNFVRVRPSCNSPVQQRVSQSLKLSPVARRPLPVIPFAYINVLIIIQVVLADRG